MWGGNKGSDRNIASVLGGRTGTDNNDAIRGREARMVRLPDGKRQPAACRRRWEDNIKRDLNDIRWEERGGIDILAQ